MILINLGRLLMVWGFLLFNLSQLFPKPLKYFLDIGLFLMVVMHALQLTLLKATLTNKRGQAQRCFSDAGFPFRRV